MRILWLNWRDIKNPDAGGAEVLIHEVMRGLVDIGYENTLFTAKFQNCENTERLENVEIFRDGGKYSVYEKARKFCRLNSAKYDLIIDSINTKPFLTPKFVSTKPIIALFYQLAREYWFYETPFPINFIGYYFLEMKWLKYYRNIPTVTISNSSKDDLSKAGFRKIFMIPMGIKYNASTRGNWTLLSLTNITSAPMAITFADSTSRVFARGADNALWYSLLNGTSLRTWSKLGGIILSAPGAVSLGDTSIMVMAVGSDGNLWYRVSNAGGWKDWTEFGTKVSSSPSLIKNPDGGIHLFARGLDNNLWFVKGSNSNWTDWKTLGGNLISAPAALQLNNGTLAVFAIGLDDALWYRTSTGDKWTDWKTLGGNFTNAPSAVQLKNGTIAVFAAGSDSSLWYKYYG